EEVFFLGDDRGGRRSGRLDLVRLRAQARPGERNEPGHGGGDDDPREQAGAKGRRVPVSGFICHSCLPVSGRGTPDCPRPVPRRSPRLSSAFAGRPPAPAPPTPASGRPGAALRGHGCQSTVATSRAPARVTLRPSRTWPARAGPPPPRPGGFPPST